MRRTPRRSTARRARVPRVISHPLTLSLTCLFALACSDSGDPTGPGGDGPAADVNGYMGTMPSWSTYSPPLTDTDMAVGEPSDPDIFAVGATQYTCTTTPYSLARTPDRVVVFNPDSEIMWLGSLLQGRGYRDGLGSLQELPIRQRAPVTVFIDLLTENVTRTVENPDASTVGAAIGELIEQAEAAGHRSGSNTFFQQRETYSLQQSALDLGISARYMGTTVTTELEFDQSREERTLTAYFVQQMFTSSMVLPQTPSAVFSSALTQTHLDEQIALGRVGTDNPPTFISNIVWGRMLMVTMTSTHTIEDMRAALTASNESIGSGAVASEHLDVLEESEIQVSAVGGSDEGVTSLIREGRLSEYFEVDASLQEARPLSYTVRNLSDNSIATVSETTEYNLRECTTGPATPIGAQYRVTLDRLLLVEDGCDGAFAPAVELYYSFSLTTSSGTSIITSRSSSAPVTVEEGGSHNLTHSPILVDLYAGGSNMTISGNAYDEDSGSTDETIGSWTLNYGHPVANGQRYFTRSGDGCRTRLYLTITKEKDIYAD